MSQLFDYTKNKIFELIEKIEKKKNSEKFYLNDNGKQKKQLREVNELIKELIEKLKKDWWKKMPEMKFNIGDKDYSLYCEDGEENELKKAVEIVNEKMDLFKNDNEIPLARKFLMISILIANDLSQNDDRNFDQSMKNQIDELFVKIEEILDLWLLTKKKKLLETFT